MVSPELRNSIFSPSQDLAQWLSWYWAAELIARQTFAYPLHLASRKMNVPLGSGNSPCSPLKPFAEAREKDPGDADCGEEKR